MKALRILIGVAVMVYFGIKLIHDGNTLYRDTQTVSSSRQ